MPLEDYGFFDDASREFVIRRPDTPAPWVNYLFNDGYAALISQTAGGYSFHGSARDGRITRHRYNALPLDQPGHYVYLRDGDTGEYWSPSWQPVMAPFDEYECRHGLGYTIIRSRRGAVEATITYFVPPDDDLEIWDVRIANRGRKAVTLDVFGYNELCLGHALVDLINQPNDQHFNRVRYLSDAQVLLATKRYWVTYSGPTVRQANQAWDREVFFATSLPVRGFEGSRAAFIGRWRSERDPEMVDRGSLGNGEITSGDAVAALHGRIRLQPGRTRRFAFLLGVVPAGARAGQRATALARRYRKASEIDGALRRLRDDWRAYLANVRAELPDPDMQRMVNIWNAYQTAVTFRFGRDASYYHGGLLFGRGYRDSCQDLLGPLMARPDKVRRRILEMSGYQMKDGSVFHLYYPGTRGGERTGHSDTPLWLPFSVAWYLAETADRSLLRERAPYFDGGSGPIVDHVVRALEFAVGDLTKRDLARFGPGDWNDTLDYLGREGRGESIWVSMFLCYVLGLAVPMLARERRREAAETFAEAQARVARAINRLAWDGSWYIRGTRDDGRAIGSRRNREGKIFLNVQSWAVLSGVADPRRARQCMDAACRHLDTPKGPKILHPPYRRIDPTVGLATRCVPGKKENGAVFNHAVSWAVRAECELGRADRAYAWYRAALPMNPVVDIDRYEVEPYVYAEYVTSPDHPTFGQASHSWLTGSSTWMLRNIVDGFLGVRPCWEGLELRPAIPPGWSGFRVERQFRGSRYAIAARRTGDPDGPADVLEVRVDGRSIPGRIVPAAPAGRDVRVEVLLGPREGGSGD